MSQSIQRSTKDTSKKFKAVLAGGLVLGVGAAVTLASWTDQEWATGVFSTGSFEIETSIDGNNFHEKAYETEEGDAELKFDLTGADNMYPGQTVAAPFVMRLDGQTTYDANVKLVGAATDATAHPNFDHLSYGIVQVDDVDECIPGAKGPEVLRPGSKLNAIDDAVPFGLQSGAEGSAGNPVTLCFQVTADNNLKQVDESVTASWKFNGESIVAD